jgi:hypothetical protein
MRPSGWHDGQKMLVCAVMRGEVLRYERNGHALVVDTTATCSLFTSGAFPSRTVSVLTRSARVCGFVDIRAGRVYLVLDDSKSRPVRRVAPPALFADVMATLKAVYDFNSPFNA